MASKLLVIIIQGPGSKIQFCTLLTPKDRCSIASVGHKERIYRRQVQSCTCYSRVPTGIRARHLWKLKVKFYKGENKSTKAYVPLELIHYEAYKNMSDAKRREKYLKGNRGKTTLQTMLKEFLETRSKKEYN